MPSTTSDAPIVLRRRAILKRRDAGETWVAIAASYGVAQSTVANFLASEEPTRKVVPRPRSIKKRDLADDVNRVNVALSTMQQSGMSPQINAFVAWMRSQGRFSMRDMAHSNESPSLSMAMALMKGSIE